MKLHPISAAWLELMASIWGWQLAWAACLARASAVALKPSAEILQFPTERIVRVIAW